MVMICIFSDILLKIKRLLLMIFRIYSVLMGYNDTSNSIL